MIRPLSLLKTSSRRTSSSTGAAAVPIRVYSSLDDTEGILASMRNLLGKRALRRAWTAWPSHGEPAFSPHVELTQSVTRASNDNKAVSAAPLRALDHSSFS